MKKNITINDNLADILRRIQNTTEEQLKEFIKSNPTNVKVGGKIKTPDIDMDLDYDGSIHQIVDQAVPIYTQEIKDLWYLYDQKFEAAYENAGLGEKKEENWKAVAIYFYLYQELREWYEDKSHAITKKEYNKIMVKNMSKCLERNNKPQTLNIPNI